MLASEIEKARHNMIEQQIRPVEIIDERALAALGSVPRERFADEPFRSLAFADTHLPLSNGDVMMTPIQEGLMLQALQVQPGERVLEVGTGSGFITACLAYLGGEVTSYEIDPATSQKAGERLQALNIKGVDLKVGDIFPTPLHESHYDVIAVTGSVPDHVEKFDRLLAPGGRLFVIEGEDPVMTATLTTRGSDGNLKREVLGETSLPPLKNAPVREKFVF